MEELFCWTTWRTWRWVRRVYRRSTWYGCQTITNELLSASTLICLLVLIVSCFAANTTVRAGDVLQYFYFCCMITRSFLLSYWMYR